MNKKSLSPFLYFGFLFLGFLVITFFSVNLFYKDFFKMDLPEDYNSCSNCSKLFSEDYKPRVKLLKLLEIVGMEPLNNLERPLFQINNWAQKNLLRKGERWEKQTDQFEELKPKIQPLLKDLGFVEAVFPKHKQYQGALVHGALLLKVRLRLFYLVSQWSQGIRFSDLYFLSGERPLDPLKENEEVFFKEGASLLKIKKESAFLEFPKTECEMMKRIWAQSEIPDEMRSAVKVHFVSAPMRQGEGGKLIRPATEDTVTAWLKLEPPSGFYLAVTNAPYICRQDLIVASLLPKGYKVETVGSEASKQEKMAIFLDECARYIFQLKEEAK